jgi:prepilin-type N-terminal cleavage/methylation domain-containing protein
LNLSRPRQAAYTLAELLVAMAIGSLLLTAVVVTFASIARLMRWVGARADLGSATLLSLDALSRELRTSAFESITIVSGPTVLAFQVQDPAAANPATYVPAHGYVIYYDDGHGNFVRKTWTDTQPPSLTPDPLTTASRLSPAQVAQIVATPDGSEHVVASGVVSVTCSPSVFPTTDVVAGVAVSLQVQKPISSSQIVSQTVTTMIYPRNHP